MLNCKHKIFIAYFTTVAMSGVDHSAEAIMICVQPQNFNEFSLMVTLRVI